MHCFNASHYVRIIRRRRRYNSPRRRIIQVGKFIRKTFVRQSRSGFNGPRIHLFPNSSCTRPRRLQVTYLYMYLYNTVIRKADDIRHRHSNIQFFRRRSTRNPTIALLYRRHILFPCLVCAQTCNNHNNICLCAEYLCGAQCTLHIIILYIVVRQTKRHYGSLV